jgi:hypothetical protein
LTTIFFLVNLYIFSRGFKEHQAWYSRGTEDYQEETKRVKTYSRIGQYWTTMKLRKLTVVLNYYEAIKTYSRIRLLLKPTVVFKHERNFFSVSLFSLVTSSPLRSRPMFQCFARSTILPTATPDLGNPLEVGRKIYHANFI